MMKWTLFGLAVLLGCLAAIALSTPDRRPSAPDVRTHSAAPSAIAPELSERIASLEAALTKQSVRLGNLENAQAEAADNRTDAVAPTAGAADHLPPVAEALPMPQEPDPDAKYREMQDLLARQTPDPAWETMALTDLSTTFEQSAPEGTFVDSVACAGRMCRIDLRHEPGASLDDVLLSDALVPWPHRGFARAIDEETSVLFLISEER